MYTEPTGLSGFSSDDNRRSVRRFEIQKQDIGFHSNPTSRNEKVFESEPDDCQINRQSWNVYDDSHLSHKVQNSYLLSHHGHYQ